MRTAKDRSIRPSRPSLPAHVFAPEFLAERDEPATSGSQRDRAGSGPLWHDPSQAAQGRCPGAGDGA